MKSYFLYPLVQRLMNLNWQLLQNLKIAAHSILDELDAGLFWPEYVLHSSVASFYSLILSNDVLLP